MKNGGPGRKKKIQIHFDSVSGVLNKLSDFNCSPEDTNLLLQLTSSVLQQQKLDLIHDKIDQNILQNTYSVITEVFDPSDKNSVNQVSRAFRKYLFNVSKENQGLIFGHLGSILHEGILENALNRKSSYTLKDLLNESPEIFYNNIDARLTNFIYNAVGLSQCNSDKKKFSYKVNIVENFIKARDIKYVGPVGLQQGILMYIFSNRNTFVTEMFGGWAGAKGSLSYITDVLKRSEETSQRSVPDETNVYFMFDNVQHLVKKMEIICIDQNQGTCCHSYFSSTSFPRWPWTF